MLLNYGLKKNLENHLDSKDIKPVNPKGNQPWIFIRRIVPGQYFGHLMWRAVSLEKTLMLGKTESKRRKQVVEDEMVKQLCWLNGHEFEQISGDSGGQRSLVCYSSWGCKELDMTKWIRTRKTNGMRTQLYLKRRWFHLQTDILRFATSASCKFIPEPSLHCRHVTVCSPDLYTSLIQK